MSEDMEHSRIEERNLVDRYVRGTMPPAERAEFEEHFVECRECQEQLEIAKSLRQAIRESPAETSTGAGWRWATLAACAALVIVSVFFLLSRQRSKNELTTVRLSLERAPVVFGLSLSRGAAEPRDITIPNEPRWMIFLAEIDATRYSRYRASMIGSRGVEIWSQDGIQPNSPDSISVAIPSGTLQPGSYTLAVSGAQPDGSPIAVARFPLRLTASALQK